MNTQTASEAMSTPVETSITPPTTTPVPMDTQTVATTTVITSEAMSTPVEASMILPAITPVPTTPTLSAPTGMFFLCLGLIFEKHARMYACSRPWGPQSCI